MSREEAWRSAKGYLYDALSGEEADEIIKALEHEPCEDAISRQTVLDMLEDINAETEGVGFYYEHYVEYIKKLSSVKPQEAKWIPVLPEKAFGCLVAVDFAEVDEAESEE